MSPALRRVRIDLAYDGTAYSGWQVQRGVPTIQGTLEAALTRIEGGRRVATRGAGRTDAGVHARGQVADALVSERHSDADIVRALRALLPADIRLVRAATVAPEFHARRDALEKTYRYRIDLSVAGSPFLARYALHHGGALDRGAVEEALARLTGRRDFSAFAGASCEVGDRVRDLRAATLEPEPGALIALAFRADGFLTHMVRNMTGTLLEIGRGRYPARRIEEILASRDRRLAGPTAPAHALSLESVVYASAPASGTGGCWPIIE